MARITVEDCLANVTNRFDLVLKASKRARELSMGAEATLPWDNDKPTVMALREIAAGTILTRELDASEHFDIEIAPRVKPAITFEPLEDADLEAGDTQWDAAALGEEESSEDELSDEPSADFDGESESGLSDDDI